MTAFCDLPCINPGDINIMTFRVGMKVVCVDDSPTSLFGERQLVFGEIYTIRWAGVAVDFFGEFPGVRLVEVPMHERSSPSQDDVAFASRRFRPAVSPKQEVSFTTGADPGSEAWDNRRRIPAREGAGA